MVWSSSCLGFCFSVSPLICSMAHAVLCRIYCIHVQLWQFESCAVVTVDGKAPRVIILWTLYAIPYLDVTFS